MCKCSAIHVTPVENFPARRRIAIRAIKTIIIQRQIQTMHRQASRPPVKRAIPRRAGLVRHSTTHGSRSNMEIQEGCVRRVTQIKMITKYFNVSIAMNIIERIWIESIKAEAVIHGQAAPVTAAIRTEGSNVYMRET